jgi:metal-responsive CopG/Arc/MetJ family transcriptional regulator
MAMAKVAITIEENLLDEVDKLVQKQVFSNRSKAIQEALQDKLAKLRKTRLAAECAKLDPKLEKALAEEGMDTELETWPAY